MQKTLVAIIEENPEDIRVVKKALKESDLSIEAEFCQSLEKFFHLLNAGKTFDLIISEGLPVDGDAASLLQDVRIKERVPVVFTCGAGNEELAVSLVKKGALDYFVKSPAFFAALPSHISRALREWENIQARKEAEALLRKAESKYRMVTENINDVLWEVDIDFQKYLFISNSIEGFLGYKRDEFLKIDVSEGIQKESAKLLEEFKKELLYNLKKGVKPEDIKLNLEIQFKHKDGSARWGSVRGFLVTNKKNQIISVSGITRNITEQKEAERQLKIQEAFFGTLINEAPLAIAILDNDDNVQQVNNHFCELFGYDKKECMNVPINSLIVPEEFKEEGEKLTGAAFQNEYIQVETQRMHKSGKLIDVEIIGQSVLAENKKLGVLGIYHDITLRKKNEKKLKTLSERLMLATESAAIGIWDYNLKTKELIWEQEMFNLHGLDPKPGQELMQAWESVVVDSDKALLNFVFNQKVFLRDTFEKVYRIYAINRKVKHIRLFASVHFDKEQTPTRIVGCCWDITNEIENQELNKKIEVSAKVANIKQQFLANMSHEIRSPMTGILGMIDLLAKTSLDDKQRFYAETIRKSSDGLLNIVNDILDLSKIEAGKMLIKPSLFDLKASGNNIFSLFRALAGQKGLEFTVQFDPDLPRTIYADENRINQIVTNLLSNAIKFTEKGWVKLAYEQVEEKGESVVLRISIADSGIGINEQDQSRLFGMFSQLDASDTRSYDGTGLGLSISEKLADLMNATIDVQSQLGKGSVFSLTLKVAKGEPEAASANQLETVESISEGKFDFNVLLVEDKTTNQMVISLMLREIGCAVEIAVNGQDALEKIAPGKYDVVFMDVQMPVMDGLTAVKKLRVRYKERDLPVIIGLSAKAMEGDAEYHISRGMNDYLTKPVTTEILTRCLGKWQQKIKR